MPVFPSSFLIRNGVFLIRIILTQLIQHIVNNNLRNGFCSGSGAYTENELLVSIQNSIRFICFLADCVDLESGCPKWANDGDCDTGGYVKWMRANCKHSCGLCIQKGRLCIPCFFFINRLLFQPNHIQWDCVYLVDLLNVFL